MSLSIFVSAHLDERARTLIRTSLPNERLRFAERGYDDEATQTVLSEAEIVFGNLPPPRIEGCASMRWMQLESIGFEHYKYFGEALKGRLVTNLRGMFDRPAVETALAGILALSRGLPTLLRAQPSSQWVESEVRPRTRLLHGQRALVLGFGSIGRRMSELLAAFNCEVTTFARRNPEASLCDASELPALFSISDLVICCLPETEHTEGLVSSHLLGSLSSHAVFVNIGRGAVVDEVALVALLEKRSIGGAVIDVTAAEPIPDDHPLWRCPNTVLTQHTAGGYADELVDKARLFLENLERYRKGSTLLNIVDLARGY